MDKVTEYGAYLLLAQELADIADAVSMNRFQALDLHVEQKADFSLVSDADRAVESAIRARLQEARPSDSILGEEEGTTGSSTHQWIIDPIDGTHNFVRGVPVWATMIGLAIDGKVVVGVVSAPALSRRWWAAEGLGSFTKFRDEKPRLNRVSEVREVEDAFFCYASFDGWVEQGKGQQFFDLAEACWRTRGFGDFWSYMLVAEGTVDVAAEPELETYDMAALVPIVTEAGGKFTGLDGVDGPWSGSAVASNGHLQEKTLKALG